MKSWLYLAGIALLGSMVGVAAKIVISNHSAALQPTTAPAGTAAS